VKHHSICKQYVPSYNKQHKADTEVGGDHVDPDVDRERQEEREQVGWGLYGLLEDDRDAQVEERHSKVHNPRPIVCYGQPGRGYIGFLLACVKTI